MKKGIAIGILVLVALSFLYIWPGVWRYRYRHEEGSGTVKQYGIYLPGSPDKDLRTDVLTGRIQVYDTEKGRWRKLVDKTLLESVDENL